MKEGKNEETEHGALVIEMVEAILLELATLPGGQLHCKKLLH